MFQPSLQLDGSSLMKRLFSSTRKQLKKQNMEHPVLLLFWRYCFSTLPMNLLLLSVDRDTPNRRKTGERENNKSMYETNCIFHWNRLSRWKPSPGKNDRVPLKRMQAFLCRQSILLYGFLFRSPPNCMSAVTINELDSLCVYFCSLIHSAVRRIASAKGTSGTKPVSLVNSSMLYISAGR